MREKANENECQSEKAKEKEAIGICTYLIIDRKFRRVFNRNDEIIFYFIVTYRFGSVCNSTSSPLLVVSDKDTKDNEWNGVLLGILLVHFGGYNRRLRTRGKNKMRWFNNEKGRRKKDLDIQI